MTTGLNRSFRVSSFHWASGGGEGWNAPEIVEKRNLVLLHLFEGSGTEIESVASPTIDLACHRSPEDLIKHGVGLGATRKKIRCCPTRWERFRETHHVIVATSHLVVGYC